MADDTVLRRVVEVRAKFNHHWCTLFKNEIIKEREDLIIGRIKLCNSFFPPLNCHSKIAQDFSDLRANYAEYISHECSFDNW
jgi:hypothetical protein